MIEKMERDDLKECADVIRRSFRTVADQFGFTEENTPGFTAFSVTQEELLRQTEQEQRIMYGYREDGRIIGFYALSLHGEAECELHNLCVLPEYRHKEIGRKMLEHAFFTARQNRCTKMHIGIVEENRTLRRWYEQFGFIHTGTEKFDFFPFTCGYMVKDL